MSNELVETMARMEALIAQRKTAVAEAEAAAAKVDSLDAEIRAVAAQLAGNEPRGVGPHVHNGHRHGTNGASISVVPSADLRTLATEVVERERLAPRKLELIKLVSDRREGEADLGFLAIRMYGNEGRSARVNVSAYCTDLKAEGYVEPGSRAGTWRLTEKGKNVAIQG